MFFFIVVTVSIILELVSIILKSNKDELSRSRSGFGLRPLQSKSKNFVFEFR